MIIKFKSKLNKLNTKKFKKAVVSIVVALNFVALTLMSVSAAGNVDTSSFISTSMTVLKTVICLIGAGLGIWGVVNLIEGYGNDNPGAKSQGMKQFCAGIALIILAIAVVPVLENMFTSAL